MSSLPHPSQGLCDGKKGKSPKSEDVSLVHVGNGNVDVGVSLPDWGVPSGDFLSRDFLTERLQMCL